MSGTPYIDQDTLDECREALRQGSTLDFLAGQMRMTPDTLANLLGIPQWKQIPVEPETDLFALDRLEDVL